MQKPACPLLLVLLVAVSLLPAAPVPLQRISQPNPPQPQQPAGHPAPAPSPAPAPKPRSADQLRGQEFREHTIHDSTRYDPTEARHDFEVGHFYRIQGDYRGALSRFQSALHHDPNATEAMYEAGETELKLHQPEQARDYFQQYLAADPHGKHAHHVQSVLKKLNRKLAATAPKR